MSDETVRATTTIEASAGAVFAVLADPARHAAIDGTGWVLESHGDAPLTHAGQIFRMGMFHPDHPDGTYEISNEVLAFDPPHVVSWRPGYYPEGASELAFGGWVWRYDLGRLSPERTEVTLTYDWSAVGPEPRTYLTFPPFPPDHLASSLAHLADLVALTP